MSLLDKDGNIADSLAHASDEEVYRRAAGNFHVYPVEDKRSIEEIVSSLGVPAAYALMNVVKLLFVIASMLVIASIVLGGK